MKKPITIADADCLRRLNLFRVELEKLCDRYHLDIQAEEGHHIEVQDRLRPENKEWPLVAWFAGVDERRMYTAGARRSWRAGLELCYIDASWPEDQRALAAARKAGTKW